MFKLQSLREVRSLTENLSVTASLPCFMSSLSHSFYRPTFTFRAEAGSRSWENPKPKQVCGQNHSDAAAPNHDLILSIVKGNLLTVPGREKSVLFIALYGTVQLQFGTIPKKKKKSECGNKTGRLVLRLVFFHQYLQSPAGVVPRF